MDNAVIKVSVKNLIEYSLRRGSIDFRYQSAKGVERGIEGTIIHKKLQKKRKEEANLKGFVYESERAFAPTFNVKGVTITVRGRADGILIKDGSVYIEEIKTTQTPLNLIAESELHIAQAKCYCYFYMLENNTSEMTTIHVMLTYYNTQTADIKNFEYTFNLNDLEAFFHNVLNTYAQWAIFTMSCREDAVFSSKALEFPYNEYRKYQREMCAVVYKTIEKNTNVFINAPTGIGKTISTLFAALKSLPGGGVDKIFYLTAKTITGKAAIDAMSLMNEKGLSVKVAVITAKEKACFMDEAICEAESCIYANGHFDRINEALFDLLSNENIFTGSVFSQYAEKHKVCPYEFSLEASLYCDVIVCDYNYAFNPRVYLRRFFAETNEKYVFLIDEAHNLVDRARDMYSADIYALRLKKTASHIKKVDSDLKASVLNVCESILNIAEKITEDDLGVTMEAPPVSILYSMRDFCREADRWLFEKSGAKRPANYEEVLDLYFEFNYFLTIYDFFDDKYICYCQREQRDIILKLFCVDTSGRMEAMLKNAVSSVFFSATLTPPDYYKKLLGAKEEDLAISLPSPFPKENLAVAIVPSISAKYKNRANFYDDIADYIYVAINEEPGSYFAFFPSYAYMEGVYNVFADKYPQVRTSLQSPDMSETQKEDFLKEFTEQNDGAFVSFAVLGGMFSEGIDLPGKKLLGAFIISVGLPKICFERMLISRYFNELGDSGFEYAYIAPGINKVLQGGGRVIRTAEDKGIIILIDERFSHTQYKRLFPENWKGFATANSKNELKAILSDFWHRH